MSLAALSYFMLNNNPVSWRTAELNAILITGNKIYEFACKRSNTQRSDPLTLTDVLTRVKFGDKIFDSRLSDHNVTNKLSWNNLVAGLKQFFEEETNLSGIFTYDTFSLAVMREANSLFLLNSQATAYDGEPLDPRNNESAACLMQMFSINCLAERLLEACNQTEMMNDQTDTSRQSTQFSINGLIFVEQLSKTPTTNLNRKRKLITNEITRKSGRINRRVAKRKRDEHDSEQQEVRPFHDLVVHSLL